MEYTMKAIKNEDILSFVGKLMELENIILSEILRPKRTCMDIRGKKSMDYPRYSTQDYRTQKGQQAEGSK